MSVYYVGGSYQVNDDQRFELYLGSVHKDMDRTYTNRTSGTYSQELSGDIDGYDETGKKMRSSNTEKGRFFNQNL